MPFSYDIEPDESPRRRRHASRVESKQESKRIEVKALGPNIRSLARATTAVYDPNAEDGDGDGLVQDSTPFERPAALSNIAGVTRGLASATGTSGLFSSSGSWTVGLSNAEVAERAVPDNPADFVTMMAASVMGNYPEITQFPPFIELMDAVSFDPEDVALLRTILKEKLDASPQWRAAIDRFGMPPYVPTKGQKGAVASAAEDVAIFVEVDIIGAPEGADNQAFNGRQLYGNRGYIHSQNLRLKWTASGITDNGLVDSLHPGPMFGNYRATLIHEWGHYLNNIAVGSSDFRIRETAQSIREFDDFQPGGSPFETGIVGDEGVAGWNELIAFLNGAYDAERRGVEFGYNKPDDRSRVPWVGSLYGLSKPMEWFAEAVSAYLSDNEDHRAILNEAGARFVEAFLGIRPPNDISTPTQRMGLASTTGTAMRGMTPQQIADLVVPSTPEQARDLAIAHNEMLFDDDGNPYLGVKDSALRELLANGLKDIDFSPQAVEQMKAVVVEALVNNPDFHEVVQRYGMPPVMVTRSGVGLDGSFGVSGVEGFPALIFSSEELQKALVNGVGNGMYENMPQLRNTDRFLADPSVSGLFIHEWAHFLNRLAKDQHPDDETRALAQFWWSDTWEMDAYLPRMVKLLRRFVKAETRADARFMGAQKFGAAVASGKRVNFTRGYPHVMGQYGQSMPAEAFAEAVTAILSRNVNDRELVSPEMRRDVLDILDLTPTVRETQRAGMASRTGGSTPKTVTRGPNGVRIIDPNDPFTPLSGADWLKDATDAEIAEAVVPMNADDAIAMVTMNIAYGADPSNFPQEALVVQQLMNGLLFNVQLEDLQGQPLFDQNGQPVMVPAPYDFSPQGRQKAKAMVERMLAESPEFAWLVRNFGMPPMMLTDEAQIGQLNQMFAPMGARLPESLTNPGIGGFSIATLGVTMRPNADDNMPMGFDRRRARKLRRNGTTERWMGNMGSSLADRAIHEWAHWFFWTVKGNKQINRSLARNFGDRYSRLRYLFPNMPYSQAEKMAGEFIDGFEAGSLIPFNEMTAQHYLDAMIQDIIGRIAKNVPDPVAQQTALTRAEQLIKDYVNNVVRPGLWSPQAAQVFLFDIRREFPYLVDDLPPLIGGTYATATRQELWAEAVLLFCSPDTRLKQKYLHPEIEAWLAYVFGIKPDKDPSTPYQKPWEARGGLASSSRMRRLHAAEDSLPDRIADTNDGLASRTSGTPKATKSKMSKIASTSRFTMGDYDFDITDEDLRTYDWNTAYDQWTTWSGNWRMRNISSMMMGIETQPTRGEEETLSTVHEIMRSGEIADAPSHVKDSIQEAVLNTYKAMEVIAVGETSSDRPLYRGLGSVPDDAEIMMVQPGETITLPLSAFTPDRELANTFASMGEDPTGNKKVMIRLAPGAQVASSEYTTQIKDWERGYVEVPIESVTQGEFRVTSRSEAGGYTVVEVEHVKAFDPLAGKMTPVSQRQGLASSSTLYPRQKVSDSAVRMLEDNMEYLRDNPVVGRGGAELDDQWAKTTIDKLKTGQINQDDALNLINAVMDILNNEFDKDPAKKNALDARLEAYQKLGKRLRRLVVNGMDEDDLDDFREEQGITRKTPTTGTRAPGGAGAYPGGRFGFGSRTGLASATRRGDVDMEKATATIQKRIDDLSAELEEKESFQKRLADCIDELEKTGTWQGEKYNVFVTEGASPKTVTDISQDDIVNIREAANRALYERGQESNRIRSEYDKQTEILDGLKNDKYPETTLRAEAILADDDMVREMTERSSVVRSTPITERVQTFTAPDGSRYVIHMGSAELKGGELDPARSRGVAGGPIGGNTRESNIIAFRGRYGRLMEDLNRSRKQRDQYKEVLSGRFRIFNDDGTYNEEMGRFAPRMDMPERMRILNEQDGYVDIDLNEVLGNGMTRREAIQQMLDTESREIERYEKDLAVYERIKEDGWQVMSSYSAVNMEESWGVFGTYGGRYGDSGDDVSKFSDFTAEARADEVGIHIFRVDDSNSVLGGPNETALVGKHKPIASLVVPRSLEKDTEKIFPAWVESAVKKDIESRPSPTERAGLASRSDTVLRQIPTSSMDLKNIPSLPTSYRDGKGPEPEMRQGLASMSGRINEDIAGRFNPLIIRGKPFPGTETVPEVYVYDINGEKVVFGVEDRYNLDIRDAKNVALNPYDIAGMERGTPEGDELALKWAYAHVGSDTADDGDAQGSANSTEISALLYAAVNGDEEARVLFEQYAEEGRRIVQNARSEKIEQAKQAAESIRANPDFQRNYREFVKKKLRLRLGRTPTEEEVDNEKIELKDIVLVRWTEHEPDYDEDGNIVLDTLSAYSDIDRETIHFTLNHSVEEHMGWQQQGSGYLIMIPLSEMIEENGTESLGNIYGVDTYFTPKPGQKLRLRAGATKVRYVGDDEASQRKEIANGMLRDEFGTFPVAADPGYVQTPDFDNLIVTIAADLGLPKGGLHANRGHSYIEAINNMGNYEGVRKNPLDNNMGVSMNSHFLSDLDENSILRHIDRRHGKPTGVSLYTRENKNRPRVVRTGLASSSFSRGRNTTLLKPEEDIPNAGVGFSGPDGRTQQIRVPLGNKVVSPVDGTEKELRSITDSAKHIADGGSLSDIPDEHLIKAIMENTQITDTDGRRFKIIGSRGGVNGMVRLRDTTTGALIGYKYENGRAKGTDDEALVEVMSEVVSGYFGYEPMPMRLVRGVTSSSQLAPLREGEPELAGVALVTELAHNRYDGEITAGTDRTVLADQLSDISAEELVRLALFDTLLRNSDRHGGNILFANKGDKTSIIPIDQSLGFSWTSNPTAPLDIKGLKGNGAARLADFAHRLDSEEGRREIVEAARKVLEELGNIDVDKMREELLDALKHFEDIGGTPTGTRERTIKQMFDRLEQIKKQTPEILAEEMMTRTAFRPPDRVRPASYDIGNQNPEDPV